MKAATLPDPKVSKSPEIIDGKQRRHGLVDGVGVGASADFGHNGPKLTAGLLFTNHMPV